MSKGKSLKNLILGDSITIVPGVYDSLSGLLASKAGFDAVFLSGSAVSYSQLARPDIGLVTMNEMLDICMRLNDRLEIPILVDIDRGFGNAAHAGRAIRSFEASGASAVQVEDQIPINNVNKLMDRPLISPMMMVDKIKSMVNDRRHEDTLVSARTDSPFTETFEQVLERISLYKEAGADIVFAEGLKLSSEIEKVVSAAGDTPVLYNLLRMDTEISSAEQLDKLGVSIVLFPAHAIANTFNSLVNTFKSLKAKPDLKSDSLNTSVADINEVLGIKEMVEKFKNYSS